jgi:hypothetical protein
MDTDKQLSRRPSILDDEWTRPDVMRLSERNWLILHRLDI